MKIVLFGDSVTDAGRDKNVDFTLASYGHGYAKFVAGELLTQDPTKYQIYNRGNSGNRVVDLYARIKKDVWNLQPDVLSILIGVNDVWHDLLDVSNGVDLPRFEKIYRMIIEDTLERLPNVKIILCEPFVLEGTATQEALERFLEVKEYAKVVKKLAIEYGCNFLELQEDFTRKASEFGPEYYLSDGVHPNIAGARLIADKWMQLFNAQINQ